MKDNLKKYNTKRNFKKTSEPIGKLKSKGRKLRFVIQHHLASHDHFDLRLEANGVMKSWAIPKGPSYNSKNRRLAVMVEDHPLDYRNFEGVIPKGEYGGGIVMIWDEGYYESKENIINDLKKGTLKFKLYGKRLKGMWSLIHFKEDNWLLIKEKDEYENKDFDISKYAKSVKTKRTMSEIEKSNSLCDEIIISNPNKVIFQNPKITKIEIINYYRKVSK